MQDATPLERRGVFLGATLHDLLVLEAAVPEGELHQKLARVRAAFEKDLIGEYGEGAVTLARKRMTER